MSRLCRLKSYQNIGDDGLWSHGEITKLRSEREEIIDTIERCYKMLLSEPDTKGALFKAENILRELIADAKAKNASS